MENKNRKPKMTIVVSQKDRPKIGSFNSKTRISMGNIVNLNSSGPKPEPKSLFFEDRKNIIFNKLPFSAAENTLQDIIRKSQKAVEFRLKRMLTIGFFARNEHDNVNELLIALRECIANYCLAVLFYMRTNKYKKAGELLMLLHKQNKNAIDKLISKIEAHLEKCSAKNNLIKYYPLLTKQLTKALACILKLCTILSKNPMQDYYIKAILRINNAIFNSYVVKQERKEMEYDYKMMARYFYGESLVEIANFCITKYYPFKMIITLMQKYFTILDKEKGMNIFEKKYFNDFTNIEQILILRVLYNLSLFYYVNGQPVEALQQLTNAKERLAQIKYFPLIQRFNPDPRFSFIYPSDNLVLNHYKQVNQTNNNNNQYHHQLSSQHQDFHHLLSTKISFSRQRGLTTHSIDSTNSRILYTSAVYFGDNILTFSSPRDISQDMIRFEIAKHIEFLICEIQLDNKNYGELYRHVKKVINLSPFTHPHHSPSSQKLTKDNSLRRAPISAFLSSEETRRIHAFLGEAAAEIDDEAMRENKKSIRGIDELEMEELMNIKNKKNKTKMSKEMEKFFLFTCKLSAYQIKMLNDFQPTDKIKRNYLPILFPIQFKDCLTYSQRMLLNSLETMSLSRYLILKDPFGSICPENFDYNCLTSEQRPTVKRMASVKTSEQSFDSKDAQDIKREKQLKEKLRNFEEFKSRFEDPNMKLYIENHKASLLKIIDKLKPSEIKILIFNPEAFKICLNKAEQELKINIKDTEKTSKNYTIEEIKYINMKYNNKWDKDTLPSTRREERDLKIIENDNESNEDYSNHNLDSNNIYNSINYSDNSYSIFSNILRSEFNSREN